MRLIGLAVILALSLALAPLAAETQQAAPSQPRQVGWLGVVAGPPLQDEFRRGMRELGHVEGSTYSLHERYAGNRAEALPELAAELALSFAKTSSHSFDDGRYSRDRPRNV